MLSYEDDKALLAENEERLHEEEQKWAEVYKIATWIQTQAKQKILAYRKTN